VDSGDGEGEGDGGDVDENGEENKDQSDSEKLRKIRNSMHEFVATYAVWVRGEKLTLSR
jgi:hypothetical protein